MSGLNYVKFPQMPSQDILHSSLQLVDHKTPPLLWGHILVVRKRQHFDLVGAYFAEAEIEEVHFSLVAFFTIY